MLNLYWKTDKIIFFILLISSVASVVVVVLAGLLVRKLNKEFDRVGWGFCGSIVPVGTVLPKMSAVGVKETANDISHS